MSKKSKQAHMAYESLRQLLIHSQLPAGTRLRETEWAERLGAYRSALREAMGLLAHEGLLRRGERGGYFVPELTQRDLRDILQARAAIEAGAVRLTAEARPTSEQFKQLNGFCDQMQQMAEDGYEMGADEADRRFHQALVELSANRRLIRLYEHAPLPWMPSSLSDAAERTRETLDSVAEHRRLVELIQQGHLAEAVALIETHLSRIPDVRLTD